MAKRIKLDYDIIQYNNKNYIIGNVKYNTNDILFVLDDIKKDEFIQRNWHYNNGYISTTFNTDTRKELYLHNFVMDKLTFNGKGQYHTVDHINRVPRDNRIENLRVLSQSHQNINQSKRERKVVLPQDCGIEPNHIPKNIYYVKPRGNHGDRFNIEFKQNGEKIFNWFTTSSKTINLKIKLQHAILKLLELKDTNPEFDQYIDTLDNIYIRNILKGSFNEILKLSKFDKDIIQQNLVELEPIDNNVDIDENDKSIALDILETSFRSVTSKLPPECSIKQEMIPKYCYYSPETEKRGSKFSIDKHPSLIKQNKRSWSTTGSKKITIEEKFNSLMEEYNKLNNMIELTI
jgi:hypothetical protein